MPNRESKRPRRDAGAAFSVARRHGLGDIILLLPILDKLHSRGRAIRVVTRPEWVEVFSVLRPNFCWATEAAPDDIDLDAATSTTKPAEHRTAEFARILGVEGPFDPPVLRVPKRWTEPFSDVHGCVIFAPEAEHKARRAPDDWALALASALPSHNLVIVGKNPQPELPCKLDFRGRQTLHELIGTLASAGAVICMDSGILHIAGALGVPTVAVFGGVNPSYRIRPTQRVIALQADLPCSPCNKNETCKGKYPCLTAVAIQEVVNALRQAIKVTGLIVRRLPPAASTPIGPSA